MFLGSASLQAGNGGIARLARLSARVLAEIDPGLEVAAYLDPAPMEFLERKVIACDGDKMRFLIATHLAALRRRNFFYDSVGVARAHSRVPGARRPYGLWMCGIEVWEALPPHGRSSLAGATLPLAISRYTLDRHQRLHGTLPEAEVCWLGTEGDDLPEPLDAGGPPVVLLIGRIDAAERYSKGHREMIDCWSRVVDAVPDARLVMVGGGSGLNELRRLAAASPVAEAIEVAGFVPEPDLPAYWRRAQVFAMPSRGEGFGLVYVEAMQRGLPVIASTHDAGQEVNVDGETGYNVSLDVDGELASRVIALLVDAELRRRLGLAAQARWRSQFSFSAFRSRFAPLIQRLAEAQA